MFPKSKLASVWLAVIAASFIALSPGIPMWRPIRWRGQRGRDPISMAA